MAMKLSRLGEEILKMDPGRHAYYSGFRRTKKYCHAAGLWPEYRGAKKGPDSVYYGIKFFAGPGGDCD